MRKRQGFKMVLLLAIAVLLLSVVLPVTLVPDEVVAQAAAPTIELSYDDGTPFKTLRESEFGCPTCHIFQGVLFDLGGVQLASITGVRFYAGGSASVLRVHVTDKARQQALIDPITVNVSAAQWYTVSVPDVFVSDDFWVWIERTDDRVMPYHDPANDSNRSFKAEHWKQMPHVWAVTNGDLLIRAVIRAEIHVGEGQDYATIQEAVDAAGEGLAIIVHEGTYVENVVVDKKLSIMSKDGPSNTIVRAQNPGSSAFNVTANGVTLSGFTIQGASGVGAAAVHLDDSTDCVVAGNTISNNHFGISLSGAARTNMITDNDIGSNMYGVWVEGQTNNISGNRVDGNTAPLGSGVYLSATAADNGVHFNKFTAAPGLEQSPQVYGDSTIQVANTVNNWWGSASGPYHSSANPAGTGAAVGEGVRFSPWLRAEPIAVKSANTAAGAFLVDAASEASTMLVKTGTGTPTVWVARYAANPGGEFPETAIGYWIDVYLNNAANVQQLEIRVRYTQGDVVGLNEGSLRLYWWDGTEWKVCSSSGVNTTERFAWAILDTATVPAMANLTGTPFVIGTAPSGFPWWWIVVGILAVVLLVVLVRIVPRLLPRRSEYYE